MRFLVLGGGAQGSAAAFDLAQRPGVERVIVGDLEIAVPPPFLEPFTGREVELRKVDALDREAVLETMSQVDGVLCALPYLFNESMAELAIEAGAHYCDLGGNTDIVERQRAFDGEAQAQSVSVIPDCGLAPGMVNILAQAGIDALDQTDSVEIWVGGLPQDPRPPLNYQIVYSMKGVLDYYTSRSVVLEDGQLVRKEALSEVESVDFPEPVGTLEAFHTAGGISTMPYRYQGRVRQMVYKTLRYPGHAEIMRAIRELGLLSTDPVVHEGCSIVPRDLFIDLVSPKLRNPGGKDLVALRVRVQGSAEGADRVVEFELLDYFDEAHGVTAMMRTTGYSLAVTALMQVDGRIEEKGVRTPGECVPAEAYLAELVERGIDVRRSDS